MQQVRAATMADREQIRALWSVCFQDSESFMNWFFTERFFPSLSSCLEVDGKIVSALQSCPLHVNVRGHILQASMLSGVSTDPQYRGRGYMRQIMLHYMQSVRAQGVPICVQTPAHMEVYSSMGHYPVTDTQHIEIEAACAQTLPEGVHAHSLYGELAPLHACYRHAFAGYSGMVSRSLADFVFKFRDYASDGALCYALWEGDTVRGYCVYFQEAERLYAEEIAACDLDGYQRLLDALCFVANGRKLHGKLPPALALSYPGARMETKMQGAMGVADVSALLAAIVGDASLRFQVLDATVPQNAGVWNGAGAPDSRTPQFALEVGRLGQLLSGYASVEELTAAGDIAVYDAGAARTLAALLPKLPCYIVDAY